MTFRTALLMKQFVTHDVLRLIVDWDRHFYVCGPPPFNDAVMLALRQLGAQPDALIFEQ